jgi:hypothetical protein
MRKILLSLYFLSLGHFLALGQTYNEPGDFRISGKVGIGTVSPKAKLEIARSGYSIQEGLRLYDLNGGAAEGLWIQFAQANMMDMARMGARSKNYTSAALYFSTKGNSDAGAVERMRIDEKGFVGIGTLSPKAKLEIARSGFSIQEGLRLYDLNGGASEGLWIQFAQAEMMDMARMGARSKNYTSAALYFSTKGNSDAGAVERMRIDEKGYVGIGTTSPDKKLDVVGTIRAHEIVVSKAKTADFVFDKDYLLRPLTEVEAFVREHKHLPEVPSANEMEKEGVNVAQMNKLLLQKVEELTLYAIELKKENQSLKQVVQEQETKVQEIGLLKRDMEIIKDLLKKR